MATVIVFCVLGLIAFLSPFAYCGWLHKRHEALAEHVKELNGEVEKLSLGMVNALGRLDEAQGAIRDLGTATSRKREDQSTNPPPRGNTWSGFRDRRVSEFLESPNVPKA